MSKPVYIIVESADPDAFAGLAGRILAYAALDRRCRILFRLAGVRWLLPNTEWPTPSSDILAWLRAQEFADLRTYWTMAVASAQPEIFYCESSIAVQSPEVSYAFSANEGSLVRFLLDAETDGVEVAWLS